MNLDPISISIGVGIGVVGVYLFNADVVSKTAEKVAKALQAFWETLTIYNVVMFAAICLGLSFAADLAFPAIHNIFSKAMGKF